METDLRHPNLELADLWEAEGAVEAARLLRAYTRGKMAFSEYEKAMFSVLFPDRAAR